MNILSISPVERLMFSWSLTVVGMEALGGLDQRALGKLLGS
jgi:hypothetical protein